MNTLQKKLETYKTNCKNWREYRHPKAPVLQRPTVSISKNHKELYAESLRQQPFAVEGYADEIARSIPHQGWYVDEFQDDVIRGVVMSFRHPHKINPKNDSHIFYLPATEFSRFDCTTVFLEIYEDENEAAFAADSEAESLAEKEREYQEEFRIDELKQNIHDINKEALLLIRSIKSTTYSKPVCTAIRRALDDMLAERKRAFKELLRVCRKVCRL